MADFFKKSNLTKENGGSINARRTAATEAVNEALQTLSNKYTFQLPSATIEKEADLLLSLSPGANN